MFKNDLTRSLTNGGRFSSSSYTVNGSTISQGYTDLFVFEVHTALCNFTINFYIVSHSFLSLPWEFLFKTCICRSH